MEEGGVFWGGFLFVCLFEVFFCKAWKVLLFILFDKWSHHVNYGTLSCSSLWKIYMDTLPSKLDTLLPAPRLFCCVF